MAKLDVKLRALQDAADAAEAARQLGDTSKGKGKGKASQDEQNESATDDPVAALREFIEARKAVVKHAREVSRVGPIVEAAWMC